MSTNVSWFQLMLEGLVEDLEDEKRDFRARNGIKLKSQRKFWKAVLKGDHFSENVTLVTWRKQKVSMPPEQLWKMHYKSFVTCFKVNYSATTRTGALGTRLSNHNVFWKQKILIFFFKRTNKIQGSTIKLLKYSKSLELTWPFRKHPKNYERFWFVCKKKPWEFFVFKKRCDCIIFFQVPFWSSRTVVFFFSFYIY